MWTHHPGKIDLGLLFLVWALPLCSHKGNPQGEPFSFQINVCQFPVSTWHALCKSWFYKETIFQCGVEELHWPAQPHSASLLTNHYWTSLMCLDESRSLQPGSRSGESYMESGMTQVSTYIKALYGGLKVWNLSLNSLTALFGLSQTWNCYKQQLKQWSADDASYLNKDFGMCHLWPGWVGGEILTPLSLSPNPFRLVRANSVVMICWQMLACLYNPRDPPTHVETVFCLLKRERWWIKTYRDRNESTATGFGCYSILLWYGIVRLTLW